MSRLRIKLLAATALFAAVSLAGGTAALATIGGVGFGTGPTALTAEHAAWLDLHGNYSGCTSPFLVYDTQNPDGTWSAEVTAVCTGRN